MLQKISHQKKFNVSCIIGTRPEAIKMAPVILALQQNEFVNVDVILSGQHRDIAAEALELFNITDYVQLDQHFTRFDLASQASGLLTSVSDAFSDKRVDITLVHGDTTTGFIGALAAFYLKIPCAHVEAGLRSNDMNNPFPEEMNRCVIDQLVNICFAPTMSSCENLLKENIPANKVIVTGNTIVDALELIKPKLQRVRSLKEFSNVTLSKKKIILVTMHRRENWGDKMAGLCRAVKHLANKYQDTLFVLPVHPNPQVRDVVLPMLAGRPGILLSNPLDYRSLLSILDKSYLVLTDSGGIQEEAPSFHTPVLVLRKVTERPEAVDAGYAKIVDTDPQTVIENTSRLLDEPLLYQGMIAKNNPFGDGKSAVRISQCLTNLMNKQPLNSNLI